MWIIYMIRKKDANFKLTWTICLHRRDKPRFKFSCHRHDNTDAPPLSSALIYCWGRFEPSQKLRVINQRGISLTPRHALPPCIVKLWWATRQRETLKTQCPCQTMGLHSTWLPLRFREKEIDKFANWSALWKVESHRPFSIATFFINITEHLGRF